MPKEWIYDGYQWFECKLCHDGQNDIMPNGMCHDCTEEIKAQIDELEDQLNAFFSEDIETEKQTELLTKIKQLNDLL
jgi:hypothetical protein